MKREQEGEVVFIYMALCYIKWLYSIREAITMVLSL